MKLNDPLILHSIQNLTLDVQLEKPHSIKKIDSNKNQMALMKACQEKNIENVQKMLDLGLSPNFLANRQGHMQSPLALCVQNDFIEGIFLLLEHGAQEDTLQAQYLATGEYSWPAQSAIGKAISKNNPDVLEILYQTHKNSTSLEFIFNSPRSYKCIDMLSELGYFKEQEEHPKFKKFVSSLFSSLSRWNSLSGIKTIKKLLQTTPATLPKYAQDLWRSCIIFDHWKLCQKMAEEGIAPSNWTFSYHAQSSYVHEHHIPVDFYDVKKTTYGQQFNLKASTNMLQLDPISFALNNNSVNCVNAFLQIPQFKDMFCRPTNQPGHQIAAYADIKCLSLLAKNGIDLSMIKDATTLDNPMHILAKQTRSYNFSKTKLQTYLLTNPQWALERSESNKTPVEYFDSKLAPQAQMIIDSFVLKKSTPVVRKKAPTARRL